MTAGPPASGTAPVLDAESGRVAGRPPAPRGQVRSWLRVAWLLHRTALVVVLVLLVIAACPVIDAAIRLPGIAAEIGPRAWLRIAPQSYSPKYPDLTLRMLWMLVSVSLGAQVTGRETERGTAAFAWTQGAGRTRWLLGSALPVAGLLAVAALAFGQAFAWFFRVYPAAAIPRRDGFGLFSPALAGWAVVGVAIGVAAGAIVRRSDFALAAGVVAYGALDLLVSHELRPHYPGWPGLSGGGFWAAQLTELALLACVAAALTILARRSLTGAVLPWPKSAQHLRTLLITARGAAARRTARDAGRAGWPKPRRRAGVALTTVTWRLHGRTLAWSAAVLIVPVTWLASTWHERFHVPGPQPALGILLPLVAGGLTGARLLGGQVRSGTARFAWTQGVTRRRWAAGQIIRAGAVLTVAALTAGLLTWWQAGVAEGQPWSHGGLASGPTSLYPPVLVAGTLACFGLATLVGELMDGTFVPIYLTVLGAWVWGLASAWLHNHLPVSLTGSLWPWQFTEAGLLALLAVALCGAAVWLVRYLTA
ncbi:MAG TPA: hypothetical protein VGG25_18300 [Streptosporangiaceae bacterium]